jgi:hypothetical protein
VEVESKATKRPFGVIDKPWLGLWQFPTEPSLASETSTVVGVHPAAPVQVSRTYAFAFPWTFVETRFVAVELNATSRPSDVIAGIAALETLLLGCAPLAVTSARIVLGVHGPAAPVQVSRQKFPGTVISPETISVAQDWNAT